MSIRDNMIQQVLGNPGKYSIQQLQDAMKSGSLPAYVVVPIIQDKMQQQKQMQAAMMRQPPQSTVADQIMQEAQMTQGVDALRSNLPEDYAHGGIVAFDDGGEVERYQGGGELDMAGELFAAPESIYTPAGPPPLTREEAEALIAALRAKKGSVGYGEVLEIMKRVPGATPQSTGGASGSWGTPAPAGKPPAAGPGAGAAPAGIAPAGLSGISGIVDEIKKLEGKENITPTTQERFKAFAPEFKETIQGIEARRKEQAEKLRGQVPGEAYEEYKNILIKDAEQRGFEKKEAVDRAFVIAGLSMALGTSPNALSNIAAGALEGVKDFERAKASIKKAEKEDQLRLAHIEQARRAEKRGDIEKQIEELDKAAARELKVEEFLSKGMFDAGIRDEEVRRELFNNRLRIAGPISVAQTQAKSREDIAALRGLFGGEKGAATESQMANIRAKVIEKLDSEGFELQKYREVIGNPKLKTDQLQAIVKDPKNANIVRQVQQARREEIERRLMEQLGRYPTSGATQTAPRGYQGFDIVGVRNP